MNKKIAKRVKDAVKYIDASHYQKKIGFVVSSETDYCEVIGLPEAQKIVISFKGSDPDIKDWIGKSGNLTYWDLNSDGLHDGMWNGYMGLKEGIFCAIKAILKFKSSGMINKYKIVEVVGYSRGAGLAQLCLLDLCNEFKFPQEFSGIGFGTPSVFNLYKSAEFNYSRLNFIRVINGYDFFATFDYRTFGLYSVGSVFKLKQPVWHRLPWMRVLDHRWPDYKKKIKKLKA